MVETADEVELPADPGFRSTFLAYLEWDTGIAVINCQPDAAIVEDAPIPRWDWGQTPPLEPHPWDDPDAAEQGRQRYAQQQAAKEKPDPSSSGTDLD